MLRGRSLKAFVVVVLLSSCSDDPATPDTAAPVAPSLENLPAQVSGRTEAPGSFELVVTDPNAGDTLTVTADASACDFDVAIDASYKVAWTCSATNSMCDVVIIAKDSAGLSDEGLLSISCQNAAPSVSAVTISPALITRHGEALTCDYMFTDADGDPDLSTIEWLVADEVVATGPSFDAYQPRDVITCRVTPHDGTLSGDPVSSNAVTAPDRIELAAGRHHSCATKLGKVYCWGNGADGQLGRFTGAGSGAPPGLVEDEALVATALSAGGAASCAIHDGALKCWGYNAYGQLGNGGTLQSSEPRQVLNLTSDVTHVAIGESSACAVMAGALYCWGGLDETNPMREMPVQVAMLEANVSDVAVGVAHRCAVQAGGLLCWGANYVGQLGVDVPNDTTTVPTQVTGLEQGVSAVVAAGTSSCAIHNGALKCWGLNDAGQLGDGTQLNRDVPTQVSGLDADVSAVSLGTSHACAIQAGALKCWGDNARGQLGDGTQQGRLVPAPVMGLGADVSAVSVGEQHTCAVQLGQIKCWGSNMYRQLGSAQGSSTSPVDVTLP